MAADEFVGRPIIGVKTGAVAPNTLPIELAAKNEVIAAPKTAFRDKGLSSQLFIKSFACSDISTPLFRRYPGNYAGIPISFPLGRKVLLKQLQLEKELQPLETC